MNKNILFLSVTALIILMHSACQNERQNVANTTPQEVPVVGLQTLDTIVHSEYIADIHALKNVEIRSRVKGFLDKIHVDEGSMVKQGQLIFSISATEYEAEVAKAEAAVKIAEADTETASLEAERIQQLVNKNIVSDTELKLAVAKTNVAKATLLQAESELKNARTQLSYTQIRAPFTGRIDRIPLKEGSLLDDGALLTTLSDLSNVLVYFDISEREYLNLAGEEGFSKDNFKKNVFLELANGSMYPLAGEATFADSEFETHTGSLSLRARFQNTNGLLKHGASGKIKVPINVDQLPVVHQKSVFEIQDRNYVYVLQEDNTIRMTPFSAGQRVGHYYMVLDGIKADDQIVFEGVQSLRDGMQVTPMAR